MARRSRTQPRFMLSIPLGNLVQLGGLFGALGLIARAARARPPWGTRMLVAGWLVTYLCNHAIATGPSGVSPASASWDTGCTAPPLPAGTRPG
jgi:hypothetical protein